MQSSASKEDQWKQSLPRLPRLFFHFRPTVEVCGAMLWIRMTLALLPLLQAARPDARVPGLIDKAEMKRLSDAIKNGELDASDAAKMHPGQKKAPSVSPHAANLMQEKSSQDDHVKTKTVFFKDVAASHEKLDQALKGYSAVADKEQKRASNAYEKLGAYESSITKLRSPLQQISSKVKELHSKIGKVLEADEKERLEPLNSLEAQLGEHSTGEHARETEHKSEEEPPAEQNSADDKVFFS